MQKVWNFFRRKDDAGEQQRKRQQNDQKEEKGKKADEKGNKSMTCVRKKKSPKRQSTSKPRPPTVEQSTTRKKSRSPTKTTKVTTKAASSMKVRMESKTSASTKPTTRVEKKSNQPEKSRKPETTERTVKKAASTEKVQMSRRQPVSREGRSEVKSVTRSSYLSPGTDAKSKKIGGQSVEVSSDRPDKEEQSRSSLSRIREVSGRAVRRVKTFVSRPIKKATFDKVVAKVQARKEAEKTSDKTPTLHPGEDRFPKPMHHSSHERTRKKQKPDDVFASNQQIEQVARQANQKSSGFTSVSTMPSGAVPLTCNKDNDGQILLPNGSPFWSTQRKPTEEDLDDSGTEDDLPLDSEVLLDVHEGKKKLINMPNIPIVLDPLNELTELTRRDKLFFNRDILFGNTVRNMINLNDMSTKVTAIRKKDKRPINFTEPTTARVYDRSTTQQSYEAPFVPAETTHGDNPSSV